MKLKLKEIAAISGKPGLFKIVKPTRAGVIVESLDEKKTKLSVGAAHRVSILKEVSIYTNDQEGAIALEEVLHRIYEHYQGALPFDNKSEKDELTEFMEKVLPDYDRDKVYVSDMKKLVSWYNTIHQYSPLTLQYLLREDELDQIPDPNPEESIEEPAQPLTENPNLRTKSKKNKAAKKSKKAPEEKKPKKTQEVTPETPVEEPALVVETTPEEQQEEPQALKNPKEFWKTKGKAKAEKPEMKQEKTEGASNSNHGKPKKIQEEPEDENQGDTDDVLLDFASELEQKFKVKRDSNKKRRK
ncbi:MAG: DUF5606 domain-containing protein [Microscillaceae bacterium]|nr:DUF5606 domain-containing protein [Microscillaceae bacterium]